MVRGELTIASEHAMEFHFVDMNGDGDEIAVEALTEARILLGHAAPLHEPVASHGPFVMNTREEILQEIRNYQAGKFAGRSRFRGLDLPLPAPGDVSGERGG
ncbi:MAG: pirin-like C-terminal cupin domain-containing protein [Acidobacteriota bacterium]